MNGSDSGSSNEGVDRHESVLESALSVVRGLEHHAKTGPGTIDMDDVENVEDYLVKSRGHTPSFQRSNPSPPKSNRHVTKAVGEDPKIPCPSLKPSPTDFARHLFDRRVLGFSPFLPDRTWQTLKPDTAKPSKTDVRLVCACPGFVF